MLRGDDERGVPVVDDLEVVVLQPELPPAALAAEHDGVQQVVRFVGLDGMEGEGVRQVVAAAGTLPCGIGAESPHEAGDLSGDVQRSIKLEKWGVCRA